MSPAATGAAVLALCGLQALAAWALWAGRLSLAAWAALLCPVAVLALVLTRMSFVQGLAVRPLEWAFLLLNATAVLAAAAWLLRPAGEAGWWATWGLWALNTAACTAMVYLAFFFRLF